MMMGSEGAAWARAHLNARKRRRRDAVVCAVMGALALLVMEVLICWGAGCTEQPPAHAEVADGSRL